MCIRDRLLPGYRIPPRAAFRNDIADEDVDEVEWAAWETAREKAGIHDWRGMHDLYLATDVLALADIIEEFRRAMYEVKRSGPPTQPDTPEGQLDRVLAEVRRQD